MKLAAKTLRKWGCRLIMPPSIRLDNEQFGNQPRPPTLLFGRVRSAIASRRSVSPPKNAIGIWKTVRLNTGTSVRTCMPGTH